MEIDEQKVAKRANQKQRAESTEEIIGILTAISVVSRRLAKKLAQLDEWASEKEARGLDKQ